MFAALAIAVVSLIRTATLGTAKLLPDQSQRARLMMAGAVWVVLVAVLFAGFGAVLHSTTHHRGLGAATFALVGLGIVLVSAVVAVRFTGILGKVGERFSAAVVALGIASVVIGAFAYLAVRKGTELGAAGAAQAVADAALLVLLCVLVSRVRLPSVHKRYWVPTAVLVLVGIVGWGVSTMDRLAVAHDARDRVLIMSPVLDLIAEPDTQPKRRWRLKAPPTQRPVEPREPGAPTEPREGSHGQGR